MRVAAVQMTSTPDKDRNLATADQLIAEAADAGAELVALPELFNLWGSARELREGAEPLDGPTITWARELAAGRKITMLAGSIVERSVHGAREDGGQGLRLDSRQHCEERAPGADPAATAEAPPHPCDDLPRRSDIRTHSLVPSSWVNCEPWILSL